MRKAYIVTILASLLLLASCTTAKRAQSIPLEVAGMPVSEMVSISIGEEDLLEAGYSYGQWVLLEIEGVVLKAQIASAPVARISTLVPHENTSTLYAPLAIKEGGTGIIAPYREPSGPSSSVHFSGSFVFTL
ncbi:MAG: hypothetical protein EOM32_01345 [Spirochaetia bacterium]|nr:hypothetical protein [Spirochaetia bacterium]NCC89373.1 hypothetical protein [Spirochaetia bacterium]